MPNLKACILIQIMTTLLVNNNFTATLIKAKKLSLVQFKTEWSGSCQIIQPVYEELSRYYRGQVDFFCVDADHEKGLYSLYGIKEIPTILFFKNNEVVDFAAGLVPKNKLIAKIENAL